MNPQTTTVEALRSALAQAIICGAKEMRDAIGNVVVAAAAELQVPPAPADRSVHDRTTKTTVLFADRIPAGFEAQVIAQEIAWHHGRPAASVVFAGVEPARHSVPPGQLLAHGWSPADEYTKDLFPGATFMRSIGGSDTPFAHYDFSIAQKDDGQWVPIHGSVKMAPVASPEEAAFALMSYWSDLPTYGKMGAGADLNTLPQGWRVEKWLDHARPPGVAELWSVYDQAGEEIARETTRYRAIEAAFVEVRTPTQQEKAASVEAMELRRQALALLQQAEKLDSLKPYVIRHEQQWGEEERLVWAAAEPTHEAAKKSVGFQELQNERVLVQQCFQLEELTGADPKTRWGAAAETKQVSNSEPSVGL